MNILVSNFADTGENVILMGSTLINATDVEVYFVLCQLEFDDVHEVPHTDLQYYIFDPFWLTFKYERNVLAVLSKSA